MKTTYLRQKRSGNFEVSNKKEATHAFRTKKELLTFFDGVYVKSGAVNEITKKPIMKRVTNPKTTGKIIKATYRLSQVYFQNGNDFYNSLSK